MTSFLQYALSPLPRRKSKKKSFSLDRNDSIHSIFPQIDLQSNSSAISFTERPASPSLSISSSPFPRTRSIGVQTPVLERRLFLPGDATPTSHRRRFNPQKKTSAGAFRSFFPPPSPFSRKKNLQKESGSFLSSLNITPSLHRKKIPFFPSAAEQGNADSDEEDFPSPPATPCVSSRGLCPSDSSSITLRGPSPAPYPPLAPIPYAGELYCRSAAADEACKSSEASPLVVEVGAAGIKFGRRKWALVDADGREVEEVEEVGDALRREGGKRRRRRRREDLRKGKSSSLKEKRVSFIPDEVRGVTFVGLKKNGSTLGLIIAGGIDKAHRPRVANLRPESPAERSDSLSVGDYILSVNGTSTEGLTHEQVVGLLRNTGEKIDLEVEYEIPNMPSAGGSVLERTVSFVLDKDDGTFGFTVRGGQSTEGNLRPLLVTHIRPGGPADKEGTLKAGDRLLAIDGRDLTRASLTEAQEALQKVERSATLTIRYDVSIMDSVRNTGTPLLVEIERGAGTSLGMTLMHSGTSNGTFASKLSPALVIECIRTASIAERCGALAVGDFVAAIDGSRLDHSSLDEANQLLRGGQSPTITLEIIPGRNQSPSYSKASCNGDFVASSPLLGNGVSRNNRFSLYNNYGPQRQQLSSTTRRIQRRLREDNSLSPGRNGAVSHSETVRVTLMNEGRGIGLVLRPAPFMADLESSFPAVAAIDPGGAADKSGVICVGDRILGVNGRSVGGLGVSEVLQMMTNTCPTVILDIEFEVADSVVPSTGTFAVKLAKRQNGIGINVARGRQPKLSGGGLEEVILISEVSRGSPAHRSGTLQVGDRVLAVDNTRVDSLSLEETRSHFNGDGDVVTLRIQKDDLYSEENGLVTYTVQLVRDGSPLGISALGGEEPFDPIFVAALASGSLAERTRAIHIGDRLLAINGISLRGKLLSEAVRLLQGPEDTVTIKVCRPKEEGLSGTGLAQDWMGFHGQPALSVDSAVESWDSGGLDANSMSTPLHPKRDSTPDIFRSNCGSTVRRRVPDLSSANGHNSPNEDANTWCSSSPTPSTDSGQSEDKTDWDKMIADLNQISETCGLREKSSQNSLTNASLASYSINNNNMEDKFSQGHWKDSGEAKSREPPSTPIRKSSSEASLRRAWRTASPEIREEAIYSVSQATAARRASSPSSAGSAGSAAGASQAFSLTLLKDPVYEDFGFSVSDGLYEKGVYINRIRKGGPADRSRMLRPFDRILQVNETRTDDFDCCLTVPLIASAEDTLFLRVTRPLSTPFNLIPPEIRLQTWNEAESSLETNQEVDKMCDTLTSTASRI